MQTAIEAIYRDLDYAKSLIKRQTPMEDLNEESEESWTLVGNESDPDLAKQFPGARDMEFQSSLAQRRQSATGQESIHWAASTGPGRSLADTNEGDRTAEEEDEDDSEGGN